MGKFKRRWARLWMKFSGTGTIGKLACGMAGIFLPPFYGKVPLAALGKQGYFSPSATIHHSDLTLRHSIFVGDNVMIYEDLGGGSIEIGCGVHLHRHTTIQTGQNGSVKIGDGTGIQPRCQLSAYLGNITIGKRVEIAPNCSFYPYSHGVEAGKPLNQQPLHTKGGIIIEDDVWLGVGSTVLDGVTIGNGAVIGAGSIVSKDIPAGAIAVGSPARVVKMRR